LVNEFLATLGPTCDLAANGHNLSKKLQERLMCAVFICKIGFGMVESKRELTARVLSGRKSYAECLGPTLKR
jgi:hypothetical protein